MGIDRNLNLDEAPSRKRRWDDDESCRHYVCGFCPHDLFLNTKVDLGHCEKIHDDVLKKEFESEPESTQRRVRDRFERFLRNMVEDLDRNRIQHGNRRVDLAKQSDEDPTIRADGTKNAELQNVMEEIDKLTNSAKELGEEGKVMDAQKAMDKVEDLKRKKDHILNTENQLISSSGVMSKERRMLVCAVCGAFLVENEAEARVQDHLNGKIHTGFAKIRAFLKEKDKEHEEGLKKGPERHPDRERLANGGPAGSRDRSNRPSHSRDRLRSSRSRPHSSRRGGRSRSRSRDRHRSSRHRKSHRSRSRSRSSRRHRSSRHRSSRHRSSRHGSSRRRHRRSRSSSGDDSSGSDSDGSD